MTSQETAHKQSALAAAAAYFKRRSLVMLALGFASGMPFLLIGDTLTTWMRDAGVDLKIIGFMTLLTLSYTMTFLWAPLVDRIRLPGLHHLLGHRRSWMLAAQLVATLGLWLMASTDPMGSLGAMAGLGALVGLAGATQDTSMNAWRIEVSIDEEQGVMAAAYQWGYRIATIVAGAAPLVLAQTYNWHVSYAAMAALMVVGMVAVLLAPREKEIRPRPVHVEGLEVSPAKEVLEWVVRGAALLLGALLVAAGLTGNATILAAPLTAIGASALGSAVTAAWATPPASVYLQFLTVAAGLGAIALAAIPLPGKRTRPGAYLFGALGEPLVDFLNRHKGMAGTILAMICVYRLSEFVLNINGPFYLDLGFSKIEIAEVRKGFGVIMTSIGIGAGGFAVARLGLLRALLIGAFAQPLSHVGYIWMALSGHQMSAFLTGIALDNIAGAYAGTCLIAYMSSLTAAGFVATQYAMFASLYALPGKLISTQSGRIVEALARNADNGGMLAGLKSLYANVPPGTLISAMEKSGVTPAALGVGYLMFFVYTGVIGLFGVALTIRVYSLTRRLAKVQVQTT
ncbi:MAG: permease [Caulobacteraceae bacterium]|nr:permease [Caulobacteraceae bacterium]